MDSQQIQRLAELLQAREASLWHACGLTELAGYLRLGGIVSPAELERQAPAADADRAGPRALRREQVIVTLDDAGHAFALGRALLPGLRGPVTLQLHPRVLARAAEVEAAIRPFGAPDHDPVLDRFTDPEDLERCFSDAGVRSGASLAAALDRPRASSVEMAVSARRPLPFADVVAVWVDPIAVGDQQAIDRVEGLADAASIPLRIRRRTRIEPEPGAIWHDLAGVMADGPKPLLEVWRRADASPAFRTWADRIRQAGLDWAFVQLARSLHAATLRPLAASAPVSLREPAVAGVPAGGGRRAFPGVAKSPWVHACGHPRQAWDGGTCFACAGRYRSRWRYP